MGYTIIYLFNPDSTFQAFEDSILVDSTYYRIQQEFVPIIGDTVDVVYAATIRGEWSPRWAAQYICEEVANA